MILKNGVEMLSESVKKQIKKDTVRAFYQGLKHGVERYAWWKDGVQYVGCGVYTLKEALQDIKDEEESAIMQIDLDI